MVSPWSEGDDARRIHWPATARTGQLHVQRLEQPSSPSLLLVLDDGPGMALGSQVPKWDVAIDAACLIGAIGRRDGARMSARCWSGCCASTAVERLLPSWDDPGEQPRLGQCDLLVLVTAFQPAHAALSLLDASSWNAAMLVEVRDPAEGQLPAGRSWLAAVDGSRAVLVDGDDPAQRSAFADAYRHDRLDASRHLARRGVLHMVVADVDALVPALERALRRSAARAGGMPR